MHSGIAGKKDETTLPKVTFFPHLELFNLLQVEFMTSFSEQHLSLQVRALNPRCSLAQNASTSRDRPVIFGSVHLNTNSPARLPDSCDTYPSPLYELSVSIVPSVQDSGTRLTSGQEPFLPSSILFPSSLQTVLTLPDFFFFVFTCDPCVVFSDKGEWRVDKGGCSHRDSLILLRFADSSHLGVTS